MKKLISMTDFVLKQNKQLKNAPDFFKQTPTLGDFVACDEKGNVLEEPKTMAKSIIDGDKSKQWAEKTVIYRQAQSKVIFKNCIVQKQGGEYLVLHNGTPIWVDWNKSKTIEDLVPYNLEMV